ncbi:PAS domain-containing protein [Teredinibacter waterburyi]|uniref:PAS domain-containing protein n=1 Tax=Teredinibacter waterburyi TaxID=1500538 RepID=UPI00165F62FC|nr:PAS domain-containing protein [Teredinibacter waterburyi]
MFGHSNKRLHIAAITPFLQGDYMGEIINHIRRACALKGHMFTAIRSNSFGNYQLPVGFDRYDAIVLIRNAASPKLIEYAQAKGIAVIAVAHDYFPLDVPVVTCDNAQGVELAYDYLQTQGHKDLLYIGDITQYDLRKRYERFVELSKCARLSSKTAQLICTDNTVYSGGLAAANEYLAKHYTASGIIFGAGPTAMGFIKRMEESAPDQLEKLDIVAFDNIRLMRVLTPSTPFIDQNLDILGQRCVTLAESMAESNSLSASNCTIAPTLCLPNQAEQSELAQEVHTSFDRPLFANDEQPPPYLKVLKNTDYTSALLNCGIDIAQAIVNSGLDELMSVVPLFSEFMEYGFLSRLSTNSDGEAQLQIKKIFEHGVTTTTSNNDVSMCCSPDLFPPVAATSKFTDEPDTAVHFPVFNGLKLWGLLSIYGKRNRTQHGASFTSFTSFMDTLTYGYSHKLEIAQLREQLQKTDTDVSHFGRGGNDQELPCFEWDLEKGDVHWSDSSLELLGFTTELERHIYRKMEIFDRVHPDDEPRLRRELTSSLGQHKALVTNARLKSAEGDYRHLSLQGEILMKEDDRAVRYRCCLSMTN